MPPCILLVNPWIYDFAAYDLWSRPLGLLMLAGLLRERGAEVHLVDCMDVHHPAMGGAGARGFPRRPGNGTGKFWREPVERPAALSGIARAYSRYGLSLEAFDRTVKGVPKPKAILVTSLMTYWYPGVQEAIARARKLHPGVPVVLGGIYARLCPDHARQATPADLVATDDGSSLLDVLDQMGVRLVGNPGPPESWPYPAFDLQTRLDAVCIRTSRGCPYGCAYCASRVLDPHFRVGNPDNMLKEIRFWHERHGVTDVALYDDAFLPASRIQDHWLLKRMADLAPGMRFHTPNALHVSEITQEVAGLLRRAGFATIRLGLETSDMALHGRMDNKLGPGDFERAVQNLLDAGFKGREVGAYILMGLPGQSVDSVAQTIRMAGGAGILPFLSEYAPIPHTPLWEASVAHSDLDLVHEPLFHNNTLLPCWSESERARVPELRRLVNRSRRQIHGS